MKTTIDIPEPLYKAAKVRAIETGRTLKELVVTSLEKELEQSFKDPLPEKTIGERRRLLPEFARLQAEGVFAPRPGDRDITELISEDRDGR